VSTRTQTLLWLAQRVTGAILALTVTVHLVTLIYAVRGGLSAAEIIDRVHGNVAWLVFYSIFVVAAAIHAPLGLRVILTETTPLKAPLPGMLASLFGVALALLGWRAAFLLFAAGAP
jgi:succinate dehydrogenase subunit C